MWCSSRTMIIISGSAESTGSGEGWVVVGDSHQGGDDDDHDDDDDDDDDEIIDDSSVVQLYF